MPVPNDLTQEEEQMFAQHGVQSAGQGREPLADDGQQQPPAQQGEQIDEGQQQEGQQAQHGDRSVEQQGQQQDPYRRADGTFMNKEERAAVDAQLAQQGQQQGQEGEGQQQEPKFVPLEALHAERAKARELAQKMHLLQTRTNMLLTQRTSGQEQQQPQMPDINEDPAGYIVALEQRLARFEQLSNQDRETRELDANLSNDEAMFTALHPDYNAASDHYVKSRAAELLSFYPPEQVQDMLLKEAREIARQSWARGMSPAETIYNLSMARGYNPNMPNREAAPGGQNQGGGKQQQQQKGPSAQDIVNGVRNGQQASRSLSGGNGGAARTAELNADAILNMSDEEFEAALQLGEKGANARFAAITG